MSSPSRAGHLPCWPPRSCRPPQSPSLTSTWSGTWDWRYKISSVPSTPSQEEGSGSWGGSPRPSRRYKMAPSLARPTCVPMWWRTSTKPSTLTALLVSKCWQLCRRLQQAPRDLLRLRDHQDPQHPAARDRVQLQALQLQIPPEPDHLQHLNLYRYRLRLSVTSEPEENQILRENDLNQVGSIKFLWAEITFLPSRKLIRVSTGEL